MRGRRTPLLVKDSVSDWLVEACEAAIPPPEKFSVGATLRTVVENVAGLKQLQAAIKKLRPALPAELFKELDDEVRQIAIDAVWQKTARGKYVLRINEWVDSFRADFRSHPHFANVSVGGHATRQVVFVSGFVSTEQALRQLIDYLRTKNPPLKLKLDVRQGSWNGPKIHLPDQPAV